MRRLQPARRAPHRVRPPRAALLLPGVCVRASAAEGVRAMEQQMEAALRSAGPNQEELDGFLEQVRPGLRAQGLNPKPMASPADHPIGVTPTNADATLNWVQALQRPRKGQTCAPSGKPFVWRSRRVAPAAPRVRWRGGARGQIGGAT